MDRREFSRHAASLAGALALAGAPGRGSAQAGRPVEGHDYTTLAKPVAVPADGRIQVIEFFWYGCPHCFIFEPTLEAWVARQRADIDFRRVPVGFDTLKQTHQRVYYTWEALGLVDAMHMKTFQSFQAQHRAINSLDDMLAFAQQNGVAAARVKAAWNGFSVQSRCLQAQRLEDDYGIDRTPEMGIQGRFTAVGAPVNMLTATDWLIGRVRAGH